MKPEFIDTLACLLGKLNTERSMSGRQQQLLHLLEANSELAYIEHKRTVAIEMVEA